MNLNDFFQRITDRIYGILYPASRYEAKLMRCQGYRPKSVGTWRKRAGFSNITTGKILENLEIFDSYRIRDLIKKTVESRADIFEHRFYVTSFGAYGKSGDLIFYEFRHATDFAESVIEPWQVSELPPKSRVIFVDDLVGTGNQSVGHIQDKLNRVLPPSCRPCLFSVCATPRGIRNVRQNSNFEVVCGLELDEEKYNYYLESNPVFSPSEKQQFLDLNEKLNTNLFDLGLLLTFYYSAPDNSMPFLWKEGFTISEKNGERRPWFALLPRRHTNSG